MPCAHLHVHGYKVGAREPCVFHPGMGQKLPAWTSTFVWSSIRDGVEPPLYEGGHVCMCVPRAEHSQVLEVDFRLRTSCRTSVLDFSASSPDIRFGSSALAALSCDGHHMD